MAKLYQISIMFAGPPTEIDIAALEQGFSVLGDWLRFSVFSWYLSSSLSPREMTEKLSTTLSPEDQFVILEANATGADGMAVKGIWDWLKPHAKS